MMSAFLLYREVFPTNFVESFAGPGPSKKVGLQFLVFS